MLEKLKQKYPQYKFEYYEFPLKKHIPVGYCEIYVFLDDKNYKLLGCPKDRFTEDMIISWIENNFEVNGSDY